MYRTKFKLQCVIQQQVTLVHLRVEPEDGSNRWKEKQSYSVPFVNQLKSLQMKVTYGGYLEQS